MDRECEYSDNFLAFRSARRRYKQKQKYQKKSSWRGGHLEDDTEQRPILQQQHSVSLHKPLFSNPYLAVGPLFLKQMLSPFASRSGGCYSQKILIFFVFLY